MTGFYQKDSDENQLFVTFTAPIWNIPPPCFQTVRNSFTASNRRTWNWDCTCLACWLLPFWTTYWRWIKFLLNKQLILNLNRIIYLSINLSKHLWRSQTCAHWPLRLLPLRGPARKRRSPLLKKCLWTIMALLSRMLACYTNNPALTICNQTGHSQWH